MICAEDKGTLEAQQGWGGGKNAQAPHPLPGPAENFFRFIYFA
jgi:hypothetical protein